MAQASNVLSLILAVKSGRTALVKQLAKGGSLLNISDKQGRTAAHYAVIYDNPESLKLLLKHGANPNVADNVGKTLLDLWSIHRNAKILTILQDAGVYTDLFQAVHADDRAAVESLLAKGADAKAKNADGKVAFTVAFEAEHYSLAAILLAAMSGINSRDNRSWTPLNLAILADDWQLVKKFMREGADVFTGRRQNALDVADLMQEMPRLIKIIVALKGVDHISGMYGRTLLMHAAETGNLEAVKLLFEKYNADLHVQSKQEENATSLAARKNNIEVVKYLIEKGGNPNICGDFSHTPLMVFSNNGDVEMVAYLLAHGADPNIKTKYEGISAMMLAVYSGNFAVTKLLVENDADVNIQNRYGNTPLMWAMRWKKSKIGKFLLKKGADLNLRNELTGNTALMSAVADGSVEAVVFLVERGTDLSIKNNYGETALDMAKAGRNKEILATLQAASATATE